MKRHLLILITILTTVVWASAQPGDPAGGTKPDSSVPLSGIEILMGAGGIIGLKKAYNARRKKPLNNH